jgi:hypothetical protein
LEVTFGPATSDVPAGAAGIVPVRKVEKRQKKKKRKIHFVHFNVDVPFHGLLGAFVDCDGRRWKCVSKK